MDGVRKNSARLTQIACSSCATWRSSVAAPPRVAGSRSAASQAGLGGWVVPSSCRVCATHLVALPHSSEVRSDPTNLGTRPAMASLSLHGVPLERPWGHQSRACPTPRNTPAEMRLCAALGAGHLRTSTAAKFNRQGLRHCARWCPVSLGEGELFFSFEA